MITDEHIRLIDGKFGNLFWKVSTQIGLDPVLHDKEDCVQEMRILAFQILEEFKTNRYPDLSIEDIIESQHYSKYLKTSLWNYKNSTGRKISSRYNKLTPHSLSSYIDHDNYDSIIRDNFLFSYGKFNTSSVFDVDEFTKRMGDIARRSLKKVYENEGKCLKEAVKETLKEDNIHTSVDEMHYAVKEEAKRAVGNG